MKEESVHKEPVVSRLSDNVKVPAPDIKPWAPPMPAPGDAPGPEKNCSLFPVASFAIIQAIPSGPVAPVSVNLAEPAFCAGLWLAKPRAIQLPGVAVKVSVAESV